MLYRLVLFSVFLLTFYSASDADDVLFQDRTIEFTIAAAQENNTLSGPLAYFRTFTPAPPPPPHVESKSADMLELGYGARIKLAFSQPITTDTRLFIDLNGQYTEGTTKFNGVDDGFPGTFYICCLIPNNYRMDMKTATESLEFRLGREIALASGFRYRAGLQAGKLSQDIKSILYIDAAQNSVDADFQVNSLNLMFGIFGGVGRYVEITPKLALRLSADGGLHYNRYDYQYKFQFNNHTVSRSVSGEKDDVAFSAKLLAQLEYQLNETTIVTLGVGHNSYHGVSSGVATFLDPRGNEVTPHIDRDNISSQFVSLGLIVRF